MKFLVKHYFWNIFIFFFQGQPPQDSPKKNVEKGPAPNPPLSGEAQLKYENDRLKLALAQRYTLSAYVYHNCNYKKVISKKFRKWFHSCTCILPDYVSDESSKEFWKNSHFENLRADLLELEISCRNKISSFDTTMHCVTFSYVT